MNTFVIRATMLLFLGSLGIMSAQAQGSLMRRLQERAEQKIVDEVFKDVEKDNSVTKDQQNSAAQNRMGGGLDQELPDVKFNIKEADRAFSQNKYVEAKDAIKKALWGVELEIGQNILKTLPQSFDDLQYDTDKDRVSSTGVGFVGLIIERTYSGKEAKEIRTKIGNDSAILSLAGLYMSNGAYMQSTDQTSQKQIRFKDHPATIKYTENDGYTLSVPFGQSSVFILNGINFETEKVFLAAADNFDLVKIKKELGEQ